MRATLAARDEGEDEAGRIEMRARLRPHMPGREDEGEADQIEDEG
jgi:hypothetical protein